MADKHAEIRDQLDKLCVEAIDLLSRCSKQRTAGKADSGTTIAFEYQDWYSKALPVIRQLLPERYAEFQEQYKLENRKALTPLTYVISDYLIGISTTSIDSWAAFFTRFQNQIAILKSASARMDSLLADIRGVLQAELFDDELSVATELRKKNHLRAAGAVAGVVLEEHLKHLASKHPIKISKSDPTIAYLNDLLKDASIYDVPTWRFIQRLGDIRNLCVHSKERDPTSTEVEELIAGTEKIIKTVF